jgi:hypothetical protein
MSEHTGPSGECLSEEERELKELIEKIFSGAVFPKIKHSIDELSGKTASLAKVLGDLKASHGQMQLDVNALKAVIGSVESIDTTIGSIKDALTAHSELSLLQHEKGCDKIDELTGCIIEFIIDTKSSLLNKQDGCHETIMSSLTKIDSGAHDNLHTVLDCTNVLQEALASKTETVTRDIESRTKEIEGAIRQYNESGQDALSGIMDKQNSIIYGVFGEHRIAVESQLKLLKWISAINFIAVLVLVFESMLR